MNTRSLGMVLIVAGVAGIVIPFIGIAAGCDGRTQAVLIGVMISGSVLLGSGSVTSAIANKER